MVEMLHDTFVQFETFRSFILVFSTVLKMYIKELLGGGYMGQEPRSKAVLAKCITQTIWSEWFVRGVEMRARSKLRPYQYISIEAMKLLM